MRDCKKLLLLFLLLVHTLMADAQSPKWRQYTSNDGLPSSVIYNMLQDKQGYMWFGSENGVARFDGNTFRTFTVKDGLTDNLVLDMFEDSKGRLWFNTLNGRLCYYDHGRIMNASNSPFLASLPDFSVVYSTIEDSKGNIYMRSIRKILILRKDGFELFDLRDTITGPIWKLNDQVACFRMTFFHPDSTCFFYGDLGILRVNKMKVETLIPTTQLPKAINPHLQLKVNQSFWLSSYQLGVLRIQDIYSKQPQFSHLLNGVQANNAYLDREGNLWISTSDKGIFLFPDVQRAPSHYRKEDGLEVEDIHVLHQDRYGNIWAGSVNNNLFVIHHGKSITIHLNQFKGMPTSAVYDIAERKNGKIYIANQSDIYEIDPQHFNFERDHQLIHPIPFHYLRPNYKSMSIAPNDQLLAASAYSVIAILPNNKASIELSNLNNKDMLNNRNFCVYVTSKGTIWLANKSGLNKVIDQQVFPVKNISPLLREPISKMIEAPDGNLILSTRSKGILVFDGNSKVKQFSEKDGLASDICNKLYLKDNQLWVATSGGVSQLYYHQGRLTMGRNYTLDDGLLSNEINDVVSTGDQIYAATSDGISVFKEASVSFSAPPPLFITHAMYGDHDLLNDTSKKKLFSKSYLKFQFIAITYQHPRKLFYAYRMSGADEAWQSTSNGIVDYPDLSPGEYTFEIKARKINSNWSEVKRIHFIIQAPFWMQNWFYILSYCIVFSLLSLWVYMMIRRKRKLRFEKIEQKNRMMQLEQQALSALMNPHFIFNSLNSIQHYLQQNDQLNANKYLSLFARLTRQNMEAVMQNKVSLEDELERLELYLQFEKLRFGDKLKYKILVSEDMSVDDFYLPPMILQPFVENAIWHGLMPKVEGGTITISVSLPNPSYYQVEIRDDGIGIEQSKLRKQSEQITHNSKGMQLTIERLTLWAQQMHQTFHIEVKQLTGIQNEALGTLVCLQLPVAPTY